MSFWATLGVRIEDLECFKQSCRQNEIEYRENMDENKRHNGFPVVATIHDRRGTGYGVLVRREGAIKIEMDTDPGYNSIVNRLGRNGGRLGRDYAEMIVKKQAKKSRGRVLRTIEEPDGWLTVRVGVG
jgi:hypothetical protein